MDIKHLLYFFAIICSSNGFEYDLTVEIGAGKMECFYQTVKNPGSVEIEYQVIDGGDLDINFFVQAPDGKVLISEHRKTDNFHKVEIRTPGDMKVCMDNTFSHFATKLVFFELVSDDDDDSEDNTKWDGAQEEIAQLMDMTIEDLKTLLEKLGQNLDKSRNLQTILKMYEARDRNIMENNFEKVNQMSAIQVAVMIVVAVVQGLVIRHLFDDKSKVSGLLKVKT